MGRATLVVTKLTTQKCLTWALSRCPPKILEPLTVSSSLAIGAVAAILYFDEQHERTSNDKQKKIAPNRQLYNFKDGSTMTVALSYTVSLLASTFEKTCITTQCEQQPHNINHISETNDDFDNIHTDVDVDDTDEDGELREECRNFYRTLDYHRSIAHVYKKEWDWKANDAKSSHIPTSSWPFNVPDETEIGSLKFDLQFCNRVLLSSSKREMKSDDGNDNDKEMEVEKKGNKDYCQNLQFRIASFLLGQSEEDAQHEGLNLTKELAEDHNHPDAMCSYASCLNDGRAGLIEPNPTLATSWWRLASDQYNHVQSIYELGVAYYTGEGVVEDEGKAVEYFGEAAQCGHVGAAYMLGDCLLDGVGIRRDRGEALEWLVTAAELGHRGARSRVLAVLEKKEGESYGEFTDSSRQTLKESDDNDKIGEEKIKEGKKRATLEPQYTGNLVLLERRYTIRGDAKNSSILAKRKTTVRKSRGEE